MTNKEALKRVSNRFITADMIHREGRGVITCIRSPDCKTCQELEAISIVIGLAATQVKTQSVETLAGTKEPDTVPATPDTNPSYWR